MTERTTRLTVDVDSAGVTPHTTDAPHFRRSQACVDPPPALSPHVDSPQLVTVGPDLTAELDAIAETRQAEHAARVERTRALRAELAAARQAGKAERHRRRLELLARRQQEEES